MYKEIAWNNFLKTGNIESFLEYKSFEERNGQIATSINNMQNLDGSLNMKQNVGELLNEINKSKGDSN